MRLSRSALSCGLLFSNIVAAQDLIPSIAPSNATDAFPLALYPHFDVKPASSANFTSFSVVPLAQYADISRQYFESLSSRKIEGRIVKVTDGNENDVKRNDISYISCDPEDYTGNLNVVKLVTIVASMGARTIIILYTRTGNFCEVSGFSNGLPLASAIFSTLDPIVAGSVADLDFHRENNALAYISPDEDSYTDPSAPGYNNSSRIYDAGSTTAVAMIVLYSITGLITALFVSIIVTGAIRAHRHPERYGPRAGSNARGAQSRAKGIARAVLETIPIVKFGDQNKSTTKHDEDLEMKSTTTTQKSFDNGADKSPAVTQIEQSSLESTVSHSNPDGSDELGVLGCSICTEEFKQGEEVRVLPCNHKYHPDCVDPWLLNVSGTCPLCRIDLRGTTEEDNSAIDPILVSPMNATHMQALRSAFTGTRDERIAALRRFRLERRNRDSTAQAQNEEERRGLARRLRNRFRIRTRQHDVTGDTTTQHS